MIKCFLISLISLLAFINCIFAQATKFNSISAGYGLVTFQDLASITADIIIEPVSLGTVETTNITSSGAPFLEFSHYWTNHWRFVIDGNYSRVKSDYVLTSDKSFFGEGTDQYYSLMVGVNYHWIAKAMIELYSGLQLGGSYRHTEQTYTTGDHATDNSFLPAFQLTPIGVRVGKSFGGFAEFGFGYKGLINFGIDYRF